MTLHPFFRFILFIHIFILVPFSACSQKISFAQGKEFQNKNGVFKYVIGEDRTSFYVLRLGTKGAGVQNIIEKYNSKSFELEWSKDVSFEKDLGDKIPSGEAFLKSYVMLSKGKIYFIISLLETRKNTRSVYAKIITAEKGEIIGPTKLLAKEEDYKSNKKFEVSFSPDTSLILVKSAFVPMDRSKTGTTPTFASFTCYNSVKLIQLEGYKEIFNKEMPASDDKGELGITSVSTDNEGNLLCIYTHIAKKKDMFGSTALIEGINPGIGKMPAAASKLMIFDLNVDVNDHAYLLTNSLEYGKNFSYAVITGIFIDLPCKGKKNCERKEGTFFMKIDLDHAKVLSKEYYYFDDKLHQYYKDLFDKFNEYERLSTITSFIDKTNEDVYSISSGSRETLLITRFTKDGKQVWCKPLPRGIVTYKNSFAYAVKNGTFYMIYSDHPKNMELDINNFAVNKIKTQAHSSGTNLIAVSIDNSGNAQQKTLREFEKDAPNFNLETIDNLAEGPPVYNLKNRDQELFIRFEIGK